MQMMEYSEAEELWQDTITLFAMDHPGESLIAMLQSVIPTAFKNHTLYVQTNMNLVNRRLKEYKKLLEEYISSAAFMDKVSLDIIFSNNTNDINKLNTSHISLEEAQDWNLKTNNTPNTDTTSKTDQPDFEIHKENPLVEKIADVTSKLTFERFVRGEENDIAYQAALQVANGPNNAYNPLFIYGKSGLGKTHLLRSIQNYVVQNDYSRICVYKDASSFINDFTAAMRIKGGSAATTLRQNYADIDILIIDDIQKLIGKTSTIDFFYDTFNELITSGKQIVLAADRTPPQLGMGREAFDERVTSRLASGFIAPIQIPSFELKFRLVETFYQRMYTEAIQENISLEAEKISDELIEYMANISGSNIRLIEGFCQRCLITATRYKQQNRLFDKETITKIAKEYWPSTKKSITIDMVQKACEKFFDIDHVSMIGNTRKKEIMYARHITIYLCREMCDRTLADIGTHFGGRSHATVMHSIKVVEDTQNKDKILFDQLTKLREIITENA